MPNRFVKPRQRRAPDRQNAKRFPPTASGSACAQIALLMKPTPFVRAPHTSGLPNGVTRVAALALGLLLAGCSPALNWRSVRLEGVQATLPCKPDQAQRTVQLAGLDLRLSMAGCEAEGGLYAISHLHLEPGVPAQPVIDAWRAQALQALRSSAVPTAITWAATAERPALLVYQATGADPRGKAVHARWTWVQRGQDIYHWAVYAPVLRSDMEEPFFGAMQWP